MQTYQECTAHDDEDAALRITGLRIERRDLMLDFLKREILYCKRQQDHVRSSSFFRFSKGGVPHTLSFSTIDTVPWHGAASKVSMESSLCIHTSVLPTLTRRRGV